MKRFEYKTIKVDPDDRVSDINREFNSYGEDGWELVTAATDNAMDDDGDTYTEWIFYTFKREIE